GVGLTGALRLEEPAEERGSIEGVGDDARADVVEADAIDEPARAFAVVPLLSVELEEARDDLERLALAPSADEPSRRSDREPGAPADVDVPAFVGHHEAEVLDGRLGAIPRAGRDAHLHFVGSPRRPG